LIQKICVALNIFNTGVQFYMQKKKKLGK
jgi:hypothetical protein